MTVLLVPSAGSHTVPSPEEEKFSLSGETRLLLQGVAWRTYESLLTDLQNTSSPHLTYDQGRLEIVSPLRIHEDRQWLLSRLVEVVLEEWEIDFLNLGHTTFRREDTDRGTEPDACFYIQNVTRIAEVEQIDLTAGDPPPDLVIEIDITSPSVDKLPIYAQFGVPEIWRWNRNVVTILLLNAQSDYEPADVSQIHSRLTRDVVNRFLQEGQSQSRLEWLRRLRRWATNDTEP